MSWKEAATVLLLRKSRNVLKCNYEILMLERSSKSKFMPSAYVFPGGKISDLDFSDSWMKVIKSEKNDIPVVTDSQKRPPMLTKPFNNHIGISTDIAFRLCAIRETFEETGILLYKQGSEKSGNDYEKLSEDLRKWRNLTLKDEKQFIEMFNNVNLKPNIGSLHEWSNWLTPTHMQQIHGNRRFDTVFYITFIENPVEAIHDEQEIVKSKWYNPAQILQEYINGELWLAPPQLYELRRLLNFKDYGKLKEFAETRGRSGCERWMPVKITCSDGAIIVLPGDDLYPADDKLDIDGTQAPKELNCSISDALNNSTNHHRVEIKGSFKDSKVVCNIKLACDHIKPISDLSFLSS